MRRSAAHLCSPTLLFAVSWGCGVATGERDPACLNLYNPVDLEQISPDTSDPGHWSQAELIETRSSGEEISRVRLAIPGWVWLTFSDTPTDTMRSARREAAPSCWTIGELPAACTLPLVKDSLDEDTASLPWPDMTLTYDGAEALTITYTDDDAQPVTVTYEVGPSVDPNTL